MSHPKPEEDPNFLFPRKSLPLRYTILNDARKDLFPIYEFRGGDVLTRRKLG